MLDSGHRSGDPIASSVNLAKIPFLPACKPGWTDPRKATQSPSRSWYLGTGSPGGNNLFSLPLAGTAGDQEPEERETHDGTSRGFGKTLLGGRDILFILVLLWGANRNDHPSDYISDNDRHDRRHQSYENHRKPYERRIGRKYLTQSTANTRDLFVSLRPIQFFHADLHSFTVLW